MTKDEAIKTLREDYCGNRIICELHPDKCNREDCEIWCAINALENAENDKLTPESAQSVQNQAFKMQKTDVLGAKTGKTCSDTISRQAAIDALEVYIHNIDKVYSTGKLSAEDCRDAAHSVLDDLQSAQPEQTEMIKEIRKWINSANRGNADYFIVDKIEEIINRYE